MRNAQRGTADTLVKWDAPLTEEEEKFLLKLYEATQEVPFATITVGQKVGPGDALAAKGCVRMGQLARGVVWAGEDKPSLTPDPGFAIQLTGRGREKLEAIQKARAEKVAVELGLLSEKAEGENVAKPDAI